VKIKDSKKSGQTTRIIKKLKKSKKQIETKNENVPKVKEETNVKKFSTNLSYLIPKEAQKFLSDQELPQANKNRKRKRKSDQISDSSDKPRVRIKKKEALENIAAQLKSEDKNQSTLLVFSNFSLILRINYKLMIFE
jgi:hypothetical protein